jgi:peptide/nickel transport system permease protein
MVAQDIELAEIRRLLLREQRQLYVRRFFKNRAAVLGASMLVVLLIAALAAPLIAGDPLATNPANRLQAPSGAHIFGTDGLGRDLFSRVIYGTQVSLTVGFCVGGFSFIAGMLIGLYAAVYGFLDNILMRVCDGLMAIPGILLAISLMSVLGGSVRNVIIALTIVYIPSVARIVRSAALVTCEQTYIEAMNALGAKKTRIIWNHIAPSVFSPVIVQITYIFASAIVVEAALSFLGAGVPAPAPSWGNILYDGKAIINKAWWMIAFPGLFTSMSVLGLNLFGDGLRDILDPLSN